MRISYNSPVILTFSLGCTIVLLMSMFVNHNIMNFFTVGTQFSLHPIAIFSYFSHVMGHGSMGHLLGNLTFILLLGPIAEEKYGSLAILLMILLTALITGLINVFFFSTGLLGASGIVFMLIILVSITNINDGKIPLTFILVTILFLGKEVQSIFDSDNISQMAHILGGVCGGLFGFTSRGAKLES